MAYRVELYRGVSEALRTFPLRIQGQIVRRIEALAEDPAPPGSKPLHGKHEGLRRIRSGKYRIIYAVQEEALRILVVKVAHRREAYR